MLFVTNKQLKALFDEMNSRITHLDDSVKSLRDEIRRIYVLQTCGGEGPHVKEINQRLFNIEENLSKAFPIKKTRKKGKGKSEDTI